MMVSLYSNSQLSFTNSRNRPVYVAIAYSVKSDSYDGFYSKGWYKVEPGETKKILNGDLEYRYYYYYAYESGTDVVWEGTTSFLVHPQNAFEIKNADKKYVIEEKSEYEWRKFKTLDVGDDRAYKLEFIESEIQQLNYTSVIPSGYQLQDGNGDLGSKMQEDFDRDGISDLAIIYSKDDFTNAILVLYLSSNFKENKSYQYCDWQHMINDMKFVNNSIVISALDMGKYTTELTLKYDPGLKRIIITNYAQDGDFNSVRPLLKLVSNK